MSDEQTPSATSPDAPPGPTLCALGRSHTTADGLELTVLGVEHAAKDGAGGAAARLIVRARVRNTSDVPREFANEFGLLDHTGAVHRWSWASPARYPDALPGVATLAPDASIEGDVHVLVPGAHDIPTAALRPAVVAVMTGCGGCDQQPQLFPVVLWQEA